MSDSYTAQRGDFGGGVTVTERTGKVEVVNGVPHVCELGLALRLGIGGRPDPDAAEALQGFELLDGEERPDPGEVLHGWPVFCYVRQLRLAKLIGLSRRQVQNLEVRGLPSEGHRKTKRYPLPHALIWYRSYTRRGGRNGGAGHRLPFKVALADAELEEAEARVKEVERG